MAKKEPTQGPTKVPTKVPTKEPTKGSANDASGVRAGKSVEPDLAVLIEIARMKMPFGRYAGTRLIDLPEPYLVWFQKKGFPRGRLGELLSTLYVIKVNGLEPLLASMRDPSDPRYRKTDPRQFREGDR